MIVTKYMKGFKNMEIRNDIKAKKKRLLSWMLLLLTLLLAGCGSAKEKASDPDPFQATLPSGYTLTMCRMDDGEAMIWNSDDAQIGGLILTELTAKDLTDSESFPLMHYLNKTLWNCQWFTWHGDQDGHPTLRVSQSTAEDGTHDVFNRVLFERNSKVYDLWFVSDMADTATQTAFTAAIVEN